MTFFIYRTLLDAGISYAEPVSKNIKESFIAHPNWQTSEASLRELRQEVTFAVFAELDDLDKVTSIVENLFTLLQKAYSI